MKKVVHKIPEAIYHPRFLKFVEYYAKVFKARNGFGKWLKEYQDMENKKQFAPRVLRLFYIRILGNTSALDFQREQAVWDICCNARDATESYIDERANALYSIHVITGELAYDEDDDPYEDLTFEEAHDICQALNNEAEEIIFVMRKQL